MVFDVQKNLQVSRVHMHAAPNSSVLTSSINTGHLLQLVKQYNIDAWNPHFTENSFILF